MATPKTIPITPTTSGCKDCNRNTLSFLLVRPSVIPNESILPVPGAGNVTPPEALFKDLVLPAKLTKSRYVLRLLREGFVHVYLPDLPAGQKWQHFRVGANGDIAAETDANYKAAGSLKLCSQTGHNTAGKKLLPIANAHLIGKEGIWIAYSAVAWSDKVKARNAGNPEAMQFFELGQAPGAHQFRPVTASLEKNILECNISQLKLPYVNAPEFPFTSLAGITTFNLSMQMMQAAALHPNTKGKEMVLVLRDPVGLAAEVNGIRLMREQAMKAEMEKPVNVHALNSSSMLASIKQSVIDVSTVESLAKVCPLRQKERFQEELKQGKFPAGSQWAPLTADDRKFLLEIAEGKNKFQKFMLEDYRRAFSNPNLGRVIPPNAEELAQKWRDKEAAAMWAKFTPSIDEGKRQTWLANYNSTMQANHWQPLGTYETEWLWTCADPWVKNYFKLHFDETDPNPIGPFEAPGIVYAKEASLLYDTPPTTKGAALTQYLAQTVNKDNITGPDAIAIRALLGNDQSAINLVQTQFFGNPGAEGMRDKSFDFLKGVLEFADKANPKVAKLKPWLGQILAGFSVGKLTALGAAVVSLIDLNGKMAPTPALQKLLLRVESLWGMQRSFEMLMEDVSKGAARRTPITLSMPVDAERAMAVLSGRSDQNYHKDPSRKRIHQPNKKQVMLKVPVTTTLEELKSMGVVMPAGGSLTLTLTQDQYLKLMEKNAQGWTKAKVTMKEWISKSASLQTKALVGTLDGRLAIAGMYIQSLGLYNSLVAFNTKTDEKDIRDAYYGIMDSTSGLIGALLEAWVLVRTIHLTATIGADAAKAALSISGLRIAGSIVGGVGGFINGYASWAKRNDALANKDFAVADAYQLSGLAFYGLIGTATLSTAGGIADAIVNSQIKNAVVKRAATTVAARIGAEGVLFTVGRAALAITVGDVALLLLGAGIIAQNVAMLLTPTAIERAIQRSFFGKDGDGQRPDKIPAGDWKAERVAFAVAFEQASQPPEDLDWLDAMFKPLFDTIYPLHQKIVN